MADKISDLNERLNKRDLDLILEVNRRSVEIETEVAEQNEEIIESLSKATGLHEKILDQLDKHDDKFDKIIKQNEDLSRELFKTQVLFITGLLSLILQIISMFLKK